MPLAIFWPTPSAARSSRRGGCCTGGAPRPLLTAALVLQLVAVAAYLGRLHGACEAELLGQVGEVLERAWVERRAETGHLVQRRALEKAFDRQLQLLARQRARDGPHGGHAIRDVPWRQVGPQRSDDPRTQRVVELDALGEDHEQWHAVVAAWQLDADHQAVDDLRQLLDH